MGGAYTSVMKERCRYPAKKKKRISREARMEKRLIRSWLLSERNTWYMRGI